VEVSEIGMGGHREGYDTRAGLDRRARFFRSDRERAGVVGAALDSGVTYFDTTFGCEIVSLGRSLKLLGRREGLFISAMRVDFLRNFLDYGERFGCDIRRYTREEVDARLRESGLDYLDQFMLGAMEQGDPLANRTLMDEALDELQRLCEKGKIRFFGFSCHDHGLAARLLDRYPRFDSVMCAYSFGNRRAEGTLMDAVGRHDAAFVAMKTMVWAEYGIPVTALRRLRPVPGVTSHDPQADIASLSLRWILANPLVATTVPAMNTLAEVSENTKASGREPLRRQELARLEAYREASFTGDAVPLAVAGLLSENLRVRGHGLRVASRVLRIDGAEIDFEADDAEAVAAHRAEGMLEALANDPRWRDWVEKAVLRRSLRAE
jgi:aryl-alcohol dehydrogenase-like predicted oxidoreductase